MSATFDDPEKKRVCLENALKINPDNETAQKGLSRLPPAAQETLDEAAAFEDPDWLKDNDDDSESILTSRPPTRVRRTGNLILKTPQPQQKSDQQLLDEYIARQTAKGWQIISRTETSVQLRKPKQWSNLLLILGLILLCVYGTGLIVLLLALIDYLLQKEQVIFATSEDLRADLVRAPRSSSSPVSNLVVLGLFVIACLVISFFVFLLSA